MKGLDLMPLLKKTIHESDQILKQNPLTAHFIPPAAPAEEPAEEPSAAPALPMRNVCLNLGLKHVVIFVCSFQGFTASSIWFNWYGGVVNFMCGGQSTQTKEVCVLLLVVPVVNLQVWFGHHLIRWIYHLPWSGNTLQSVVTSYACTTRKYQLVSFIRYERSINRTDVCLNSIKKRI